MGFAKNLLVLLALVAGVNAQASDEKKPVAAQTTQISDLWGLKGERWTSQSRLPDFSYAGYHSGEKAIPRYPQTANVQRFGAKGDGLADDTQAFKAAIAATTTGAIYVPSGRYKITDFIYLRKSGVVLRGAGADKTRLVFPKPLYEVVPDGSATSDGKVTTAYSFNFAYLTIQGNVGERVLAAITQPAKRGDIELTVTSGRGIAVGQSIQIRVQEDAEQTLKTFLYAGDPGDISNGKPLETRMVVKVVKIAGDKITLNRPLRFDTRASWRPEVLAFEPSVSETGIEDIGFEFPEVPYPGHFNERGFNAIELRGAANCWVKNVKLHNADMGVQFADDATFNTVDGVVISAYAGRGNEKGHHAFQFKKSQDNVVTHFDIQTKFIHDLSVENASGNVYADGRGEDLSFDHHADTPYENLYTNLNCGLGKNIWRSGGGKGLGRHAAAWTTFWNIQAALPFKLPAADFAPAMINLIGVNTPAAAQKDPAGVWVEPLTGGAISPDNIWRAQLAKRLAKP